jgi:hypothetical protein
VFLTLAGALAVPCAATAGEKFDVTVVPDTVRKGDQIAIAAHFEPILEPCDVWGVIILPDGRIYSIQVSNEVVRGLFPFLTDVPFFPLSMDMTLLDIRVPGGIPPGTYTLIGGLVPPGTDPDGPEDAIPGYVDTVLFTVLPEE